MYEQVDALAQGQVHRLDSQDVDDRDEGWRPLLSVICCLGDSCGIELRFRGGAVVTAFKVESGTQECPHEPWAVALAPGDAAMFVRGDPRYEYTLQPTGSHPPAVVAHVKVLYEIPAKVLSSDALPSMK